MTVLDTLTLALGVDPKGIDAGLAEAKQKIDAGAKSMAQGLMTPLKAALGAVAAGLSLGAITNQYLNQADAIGKMADSIGADIEELQAWGEAATRAGGSAEAFGSSITTLNKMLQMTAATGKGPAVMALEQFGIKAKDASGKARDTFEILRDLAEKMEGMDKQKAIGFGQKLGLDRGTIMLLQSGRAAVDDLIKRQKELGVYTKEDAEIAAKANDAIADLGQALKAGAAIIMRAIVPAITWVTEKLTALVKHFREHQALYMSGLGIIAAFLTAKLIPQLIKVGALNAKIWAPYAVLAGIITALSLIFEDLWVYMQGGDSALEEYWKELGTGPELLAKFNAAWEKVKTTASNILSGFVKAVASAFQYLASKADFILELFDGLWDTFEGLFNFDFEKVGRGLSKSFQGAWHLIRSVFDDIFKGMEKMSVWDAIREGAKKAWNAIKSFAIGVFKALPADVQKWMSQLWDNVSGVFDWKALGQNFAEVFTNAIKTVSKAFTSLLGEVSSINWWESLESSAKKAWDGAQNIAKKTWEAIKEFAAGFFNGLPPEAQAKLKEVWDAFLSFIRWDEIKALFKWEDITRAASFAWNGIKNISKTVFDFIQEKIKYVTEHWDDVNQIATTVWNAIKGVAQVVFDFVLDKIKFVVDHWDDIKKAATTAWNGISSIAKTVFDFIQEKIKYVTDHWDDIKKTATTAWNSIKTLAKEVLEYLSGKLEFISGIVDGLWTAFAGLFNFDFKKIGEGLGQAFNSAYRLITSIFDDILGWFGDLASGSDNAWESISNAAKSAWDNLLAFAKGFFSQLDPELQKAVKAVGVFVAAWAFGKVQTGITGMINSVMGIGKAFKTLGAIIRANPVGIFLTVLSLIIIYWDDIVAIAQKFFDNLAEWAKNAGEWLSGVWDNFLTKTKEIWENVKTTAEQKWNEVKARAEAMWEGIKQTANNIWENIKTTITSKMTALWESLKSIFKWDTWTTAFGNIFNINFAELGQKIASLFSWDTWTTAFGNIFNINFAELGQKIAKIFSWDTWTTSFGNIFNINFSELGQKIANIFSWDEWKKSFANIFDFVPDMSKIIDAIKDGFKKAWNWILENIPGAKLFFDTGKNMAEAAKKVDASEGEQVADDAVQDMQERMQASREAMRPAPSEGVSSQAAAAATTNNVSNSLTQNDSRSQTVNVYTSSDNPQAVGNAAAKALDKKPTWAAQAANGNAFAGGY